MSDLLCERCGQPVELYHVEVDMTTTARGRFHRGEGCDHCYGREICTLKHPCYKEGDGEEDMFSCPHDGPGGRCLLKLIKPLNNSFARDAQAGMRDILGDDTDALAAEMQDLGFT